MDYAVVLVALMIVRCGTSTNPPLPASAVSALAADRDAMDCFATVLKRSGVQSRLEAAAFLVLDHGRYECVPWNDRRYHESRFYGVLPLNVVAIVHSHPPALARASQDDLETARRFNLPVIAVSLRAIWVADPDVGIAPIIVGNDWSSDRRQSGRLALRPGRVGDAGNLIGAPCGDE